MAIYDYTSGGFPASPAADDTLAMKGTTYKYNGSAWEVQTGGTTSFTYTATSGQTAFTGADTGSKTLAYTAASLHVFLNGVLLDAADYTATDGTTVTLGTGASTGDTLQVVAYGVLVSAGGGGGGGWTEISTASVTASTSYIDFDNLDTTTYSEFKLTMSDVGASSGYDTNQKFYFSDTASISSNTSGGGTGWGLARTYIRFTHYGQSSPYLYGDSNSSSTAGAGLYWRWSSSTYPYAQSNAGNRLNGEYYINMKDDVMWCRGHLQGKFLGNKHGMVEWWHHLTTGSNKPQSMRLAQAWNYSGTFTLYGR